MTLYLLIFGVLFLVSGYLFIREVKNDQSGNHRLSGEEHVQRQLDKMGRELLALSPHYRQAAIQSLTNVLAMSKYLEKSMHGIGVPITPSNCGTLSKPASISRIDQ